MLRRFRPRASRGFTLTELVIALVILGILTAMGVPAYTEFVRNSRRAGVLNEFVAALTLARSEAVKRGVPVAVCRSANGTACGGAATWTNGWLVFVNTDDDSPAVVDAGELVLRVGQFQNPRFTLSPTGNFANFIAYRPDGRSNNFGSFTYCDARGLRSARAIIVNVTGRVRLSVDTDGDGINEDDAGNDLACS